MKTQDLSYFLKAQEKKLDDDIAKLRKVTIISTFYHSTNLGSLQRVFEAKLNVARGRVLKLKGNHPFLLEDSKSGINVAGSISNKSSLMAFSTFANALLQKNIELEALHHQPLPCAI
jgi:hypothetical protein